MKIICFVLNHFYKYGPPSSNGQYAKILNLGPVCCASCSVGVIPPKMMTVPLLLSALALMYQFYLGCTCNTFKCTPILDR